MENANNLLVDQERQINDPAPRFGNLEDHISYLPDETLISVLSHLDIEEQARTSILARRWEKLWRYVMRLRFVFHDDEIVFLQDDEYVSRSRTFVNKINHILELHLAASIEDFIVIFCLKTKSYQHDINGWLRFALEKRVRRLMFDFRCGWARANSYSLTTEVICNHRVDSVTCIHLRSLDVAGDFLEYLLLVAPLLEELLVSNSKTLVDFTVTGQSLKLKHLEIIGCKEMVRLRCYNVNLVSFKYFGNSKCLAIEDTPHLVKAQFTEFLMDHDMESAVRILSHLPLLETLIVEACSYLEVTCLPKFPMLRHLKRLEVTLRPNNLCCVLCAHLLEASPCVRELKVVFQCFSNSRHEVKTADRLEPKHTGLKVVTLSEFTGSGLELRIAMYVIMNVAALELMTIDTRPRYTSIDIDAANRKAAAARALAREQLVARLPLGIQAIVI